MKIIDLINAKNAFNLSCKFGGDMQLAFKVVKFVKSVEEESNFYNDKYKEIILKYTEKDKEGNPVQTENGVKIKNKCAEKFTQELNALNEVEVKMPEVKFTFEELGKCDLTGTGLYSIYPFIKEK